MRTHPVLRSLLAAVLTATVLSPLAACGRERHVKECAAKCNEETRTCDQRREKDCADRGRKCAEECRR
jgi:hypothetical protein